MKKNLARIGVILMSFLFFAIPSAFGADEQPAAAEPAKAQAPDTAAKPVAAVQAINWADLAALLPESIDGLTSGKVDGGTFSMPNPENPMEKMSYSSVEKRYYQETEDGEGKEITIRILDSGYSKMMMAPFMMAMEYDGPEGSAKPIKVEGNPGWQMIDKEDGQPYNMQTMILVSDRVLVMFEVNKTVTAEELQKQSESFDYERLAKLAAAPAKE